MSDRLTIQKLHDLIGITPDTQGYGKVFGPKSKQALLTKLSNPNPRLLTLDDYIRAATRLNVPIGHMQASKKIEAPRGSYDDHGRPTILFERHKFSGNCQPSGCYDSTCPDISGGAYGPGGYGPFSGQYDKLLKACEYDPEAAFRACSWGAFQVLGENYADLNYKSVWDMVMSLVQSEYGHLESYVRFIEANNLAGKLRACKKNDPQSCVPFVSAYNGHGYKAFNYDVKFAQAL